MKVIAEANGRLHSSADASYALNLAGIDISARHVNRLGTEIGLEMASERDAKVQQHIDDISKAQQADPNEGTLQAQQASPEEVVAVEIDGGRLGTRQAEKGPGVYDKQNKEDKIACLAILHSEEHESDPQPEPPESFLEPRRVQRLVEQMKGQAGAPLQEVAEQRATDSAKVEAKAEQSEPTSKADEPTYPAAPRKVKRTCVASMANSDDFGPMVAAAAQELKFYQGKRRAFVADGAKCNWSIQQTHFPTFCAITDFLHVLTYVYKAALAAGGEGPEQWQRYVEWMGKCWRGRVAEVVEDLNRVKERLGEPPKADESAKEARKRIEEALSYLENNMPRMEYPRYRTAGLPITSSLAESLVGEINARTKSKQKYWDRQTESDPKGAEAILQLRAAVLSDDDPLGRFFAERPGNPYRRKP